MVERGGKVLDSVQAIACLGCYGAHAAAAVTCAKGIDHHHLADNVELHVAVRHVKGVDQTILLTDVVPQGLHGLGFIMHSLGSLDLTFMAPELQPKLLPLGHLFVRLNAESLPEPLPEVEGVGRTGRRCHV